MKDLIDTYAVLAARKREIESELATARKQILEYMESEHVDQIEGEHYTLALAITERQQMKSLKHFRESGFSNEWMQEHTQRVEVKTLRTLEHKVEMYAEV